jgi:hypothetical protein
MARGSVPSTSSFPGEPLSTRSIPQSEEPGRPLVCMRLEALTSQYFRV